MRIRRYAARLLASSAASSPAPQPGAPAAAPWLHAADDDCAFCDLTRGSDPQVAPDGMKHKGHARIAGLETDGELLKTHDLAQRPPLPEESVPAHGRGMDHQHPASEDAPGLEVAARPESQLASGGLLQERSHSCVA